VRLAGETVSGVGDIGDIVFLIEEAAIPFIDFGFVHDVEIRGGRRHVVVLAFVHRAEDNMFHFARGVETIKVVVAAPTDFAILQIINRVVFVSQTGIGLFHGNAIFFKGVTDEIHTGDAACARLEEIIIRTWSKGHFEISASGFRVKIFRSSSRA